jgi:hypothetical protein
MCESASAHTRRWRSPYLFVREADFPSLWQWYSQFKRAKELGERTRTAWRLALASHRRRGGELLSLMRNPRSVQNGFRRAPLCSHPGYKDSIASSMPENWALPSPRKTNFDGTKLPMVWYPHRTTTYGRKCRLFAKSTFTAFEPFPRFQSPVSTFILPDA